MENLWMILFLPRMAKLMCQEEDIGSNIVVLFQKNRLCVSHMSVTIVPDDR